ncbi:hypothetical protein BGY98DRAFT_911151 [Russula aff. rugulosa BPL654]|nr:hypothetical protein BGY98DRAFT_911151 [Russula aff. rugulosa BPL654]
MNSPIPDNHSKIGEFTLNNASNSDTLIEALEELFRAAGIVFCRYGHRLIEYATAVESDPVGRARGIVAMCRKSGQRREDLKKVINAGNSCNAWGPDVVIRPVQLLRDCETCWYSTFNMVDRLIELYPLVRHFLSLPAMSEHLFKPTEYEVLGHIYQILEIPHKCQELLAVEKMPILALALPTYEALVVLWKELAEAIPELSHYIDLGIAKIMEYVLRGRSRIYALAMIINPTTKFKWIEEHWSPSERADAERWMEEVVNIFIHPESILLTNNVLFVGTDACLLSR